MEKLKIKNVGPIKNGYNADDGYININNITLLTGKQGSGKSTIAKVYSSLKWLEKALFTYKMTEEEVDWKDCFSYHKIEDCITNNSLVHYIGAHYEIQLVKKKLTIKAKSRDNPQEGYSYPKIQYIPAERNFVASLSNLEFIREFPPSLEDFYYMYDNARRNRQGKLSIPFDNNIYTYYDEAKNQIYLKDSISYDIPLDRASSGFQTAVPLLEVINAVSAMTKPGLIMGQLQNFAGFLHKNDMPEYFPEKLKKYWIKKIFQDDPLETSREIYRKLFTKLNFTFIVEEMEQNLYPDSQRKLLFRLLEYCNDPENYLLLTTHSPYIFFALTLAAKASQLYQKNPLETVKKKLEKIVPLSSAVPYEKMAIYELDNGIITLLGGYNHLPSDNNLLNHELEDFNESYSELLELEDAVNGI